MLVASNTVKADLIKSLALPDVVPMTVDGKVFFGESVRTLINTKYDFSFFVEVNHPVAELDDEGSVYAFTGLAVQRAFVSEVKENFQAAEEKWTKQQESKVQDLKDELGEIVSTALTPKVFVNDASHNTRTSKDKSPTAS